MPIGEAWPNSQLQRTSTRPLLLLLSRSRQRVEAAELGPLGTNARDHYAALALLVSELDELLSICRNSPWPWFRSESRFGDSSRERVYSEGRFCATPSHPWPPRS